MHQTQCNTSWKPITKEISLLTCHYQRSFTTMTDNTLQELVSHLTSISESLKVIEHLTNLFNQEVHASNITISLTVVTIIEQWTWRMLSDNSQQWHNNESFIRFLQNLYSFNDKLVIRNEMISIEDKKSLLIPSDLKWIDGILGQIESGDEKLIYWASCWFNTLSHLSHEYPEFVFLPSMVHLNNRLGQDFLMTDQYKIFVKELKQSHPPSSIFTSKQQFYMKTCSYSLHVYLWSKSQNFPLKSEDIIKYLGDDFSQIIRIQSKTIPTWSEPLLNSLAHFIGFICAVCWWDDQQSKHLSMIVSSVEKAYEYIYALIEMINYQPFYQKLSTGIYNPETVLIDTSLIFMYGVIDIQNLSCWVSSKTNLVNILLSLIQVQCYDRIRLCAYGFLAEILSDEQIKHLKIAENICESFYRIIEHAWKHPTKKWEKISMAYLLKGLRSLSSNDAIHVTTAKTNRLGLLIELSDEYPLVYEIIWALSFNSSVVEQLRSNSLFLNKLKKNSDVNLTRAINGILWNLNPNREETDTSKYQCSNEKSYDIMISYSHKDKVICRQLYDELDRLGYRVWIDFDSMHGNVMDAMAQAIEKSRAILICMSEQYRRSNFCRAEAQYAFQKQLPMIPILLQQHYKPDGWLSFVIGVSLYIDFTKYDYAIALEMLKKELKVVLTEKNSSVTIFTSPQRETSTKINQYPDRMSDWTDIEVSRWLHEQQLPQMARLLSGTNGRSLIYLHELISQSSSEQVLASFQQDSMRQKIETVSLIEIARFRALMDEKNPSMKMNKQSQCCILV